MTLQVEKLRAAIAGMAVRYGRSCSDYGFAFSAGHHADERARLIRAQRRQLTALHRLTSALADIAGGAR